MRLGVEAAIVRGELVPGDVEVDEGVVIDVGLAGGGRGRIAVPGFVDLQVNGFGGVDSLAAGSETARAPARALRRPASPRTSRHHHGAGARWSARR